MGKGTLEDLELCLRKGEVGDALHIIAALREGHSHMNELIGEKSLPCCFYPVSEHVASKIGRLFELCHMTLHNFVPSEGIFKSLVISVILKPFVEEVKKYSKAIGKIISDTGNVTLAQKMKIAEECISTPAASLSFAIFMLKDLVSFGKIPSCELQRHFEGFGEYSQYEIKCGFRDLEELSIEQQAVLSFFNVIHSIDSEFATKNCPVLGEFVSEPLVFSGQFSVAHQIYSNYDILSTTIVRLKDYISKLPFSMQESLVVSTRPLLTCSIACKDNVNIAKCEALTFMLCRICEGTMPFSIAQGLIRCSSVDDVECTIAKAEREGSAMLIEEAKYDLSDDDEEKDGAECGGERQTSDDSSLILDKKDLYKYQPPKHLLKYSSIIPMSSLTLSSAWLCIGWAYAYNSHYEEALGCFAEGIKQCIAVGNEENEKEIWKTVEVISKLMK
ncbi:hypothetical protein ADUPG1_000171 [Aduncisulcus paluster]|uniref:Uncharacterized protein n=1 Tax=Aduncisulcus paluster TaxID=2918883 RepID=A0ABQ5K7B4_9EUKA|nr:hypothetical protein ADUPG1_000171 [Aduncisulcus paluster]